MPKFNTNYLQTNSDNNWGRESFTLKAAIDYNITDKNIFTAEASLRTFDWSRGGTTRNSSWSSIAGTPENYITDSKNSSNQPTYQITLRDVQNFKNEGSDLSMQFTYNQGNDKGKQTTNQYLADDSWLSLGETILNYKRNTTEMEKEWRGDLDYEQTFNDKSKLEAGFQLRMNHSDEDYLYYNYDSLGYWTEDTIQSNRYKFKNDIYAVYATYAREFNKLGLKAGLRAEYTDRNLDQFTGGQDYPYQKFDLYPSIYFTYYLPYNQQIQLSYSKRVDRPRGFMLNPYPFFSDAFNSFSGNPALEPEFAHSLEFNYQKYFGYSFLTLETYYRLTDNLMTRVRKLNNEGVLETTMDNINNDRSLGVEANGNIKLTSWLNINPIATVYDYRLKQSISGTDSITRSTNWNASLEIAADFKSNTKLRLDGYWLILNRDTRASVPV